MAPQKANKSVDTDTFEYQPIKADGLRLLSFAPESTTIDISLILHENLSREDEAQRPEYFALSYTWGDLNDVRPLRLNGHEFMVTENLWEALNAIFEYHNAANYYWIDAICINQKDVPEKNGQVQQMWKVYSQAKMVFAWLGPEACSEDMLFQIFPDSQRSSWRTKGFADEDVPAIAFPFIAAASQCETLRDDGTCDGCVVDHIVWAGGDQRRPEAYAMELLSMRMYFSRAWIRTEIAHARNVWFLCGRYTCEWKHFKHCRRHMVTGVLDLPKPFILGRQETTTAGPLGDFANLLRAYQRVLCADPRDRIYSMLNEPVMMALNNDSRLQVDYSLTKDKLYVIVMAWLDSTFLETPEFERLDTFYRAAWHLEKALGRPEPHYDLRTWLLRNSDWQPGLYPCKVTLNSGHQLLLEGIYLECILADPGLSSETFNVENAVRDIVGMRARLVTRQNPSRAEDFFNSDFLRRSIDPDDW